MSTLEPRLVGFATALRRHGVVAGTSDLVDAGAVIQVLGMADLGRREASVVTPLLVGLLRQFAAEIAVPVSAVEEGAGGGVVEQQRGVIFHPHIGSRLPVKADLFVKRH